MNVFTLCSTGLPELDEVIKGLNPGDNVVWQTDNIEDYISFVHPFAKEVNKKDQKVIYFRFADHPPLLSQDIESEVYTLKPEEGFESFIAAIFSVVEQKGYGAFYVFDCLSDLSVDWYSDRMLANFFMLVCPYLYDYDTIAYFALMRNNHTTKTVKTIHSTAQVIIDIYKNEKDLYIQPLKVEKRHTKNMYMLHRWTDKKLIPVFESNLLSEILKKVPHTWTHFFESSYDMWDKNFLQAIKIQENLKNGKSSDKEYEDIRQKLLRMVVTREERLLDLANRFFTLEDLIDIGQHMIGTGLIGGKAVGMLLARAIIRKYEPSLKEKFETQDSFYIGSDVFYSYLIINKCWWIRWKQRYSENILENAEEAQRRLLNGTFPEEIQDKFKELLDYFGQSPIIVRSSSLLEDGYGNAFSGKYESIFCTNQGTPEERLNEFINAIRTVYASTMNSEAIIYRLQHGLLQKDEQMAILVQRVSGTFYNKWFFPQVSGVGFSYNLYTWDKDIDPKSGVIRIVFGLGTRAVERSDDDYTRIVALNEPSKKPQTDIFEIRRFSQHKMDLLDLEENSFKSEYIKDIIEKIPSFPVELFATYDSELANTENKNTFPWIFTFDKILTETSFIPSIRKIMKILSEAYNYPVDIEFTANFNSNGECKINLVQCRPYQVKIGNAIIHKIDNIQKDKIIFQTEGPIIGSSLYTKIDRIIYISPSKYSHLSEQERYEIARLIGKITNLENEKMVIMLLGPGRWGTSTPSLGVPAHFGDIKNVSILCEIAQMHEGLIPDISLGTHFFNDLVELNILYIAIQPNHPTDFINKEFFESNSNLLPSLIPDDAKWSDVVHVIDLERIDPEYTVYLNVNTIQQRSVCYRAKKQEVKA